MNSATALTVDQPAARVRGARRRGWGAFTLLSPALALVTFACLIPMLIFLRFSFLTFSGGKLYDVYSLGAYRTFLTSAYYHQVLLDTLWIGALVTVLTLVIGYPLAYAMWLAKPLPRGLLGVIVFMPLLVSEVVRTYGFQVLLSDDGPVNWLIEHGTGSSDPVPLLFNRTGVVIALVHVTLPLVVFPIYSSLRRVEPSLREAAEDLGARWSTFLRRVVIPLSLPGVVAGAEITATVALGSFVTPSLLGGGKVTILPVLIYNDTNAINWPAAAVSGLLLMIIAVLIVLAFQRLSRTSEVA